MFSLYAEPYHIIEATRVLNRSQVNVHKKVRTNRSGGPSLLPIVKS